MENFIFSAVVKLCWLKESNSTILDSLDIQEKYILDIIVHWRKFTVTWFVSRNTFYGT